MSKKISTIFLSLFLVGIFSISCSNEDKTAPKGIEQYNGNTYVSTETYDVSSAMPNFKTAYLWVSIKDGQVATFPNDNNTTAPDFTGTYFTVTGSGTDYGFSINNNKVVGTLKFSDTSVTLRYTANPDAPAEMLNTDIVCNIKK
ncbi:hypothetical protein [Brachyspira innocens]|uniref:hypothetical protein n=1 Tax=Brachyspira innocens TaxID=13264 RepID=UPI0026F28F78|nr:hypothetical protein [Brachyspira innocens]